MNEGKIAVRYAKALFSLAKEQNIHDLVRNDLQNIYNLIVESSEFKQLLDNPVVKLSQKKELVNIIFKDKVHPVTLQFLDLIFENKREQYLSSIARVFSKLFRLDQGIKMATLVIAKPLPGDIKETIKSFMFEELNFNIELEEKTDEKIIGGFVLRVEDQQIDASVSSHLKKIKKELLNS